MQLVAFDTAHSPTVENDRIRANILERHCFMPFIYRYNLYWIIGRLARIRILLAVVERRRQRRRWRRRRERWRRSIVPNLIPKQAQQNVKWRLIFWMQLEARTLEPLHLVVFSLDALSLEIA